MTSFDPSRSRRYHLPPLWVVPLLLIGAIFVVVYVSAVAGLLGLVGALALVAWIEPKVDAYVRDRQPADD